MTSQDVDNYKQIKSDLDQLRSIVEKSELWVYKRQGDDGMDGDGAESDNKKKVQSTEIMQFLSVITTNNSFSFLFVGQGDSSSEGKSTESTSNYNYRVVKEV